MLKKIAYLSVFLMIITVFGCGTMNPNLHAIKKRAYETRKYDATYDESWKGVMTLFHDLDLMPSFTDKEAGIIKAEVPYTDYKITKKIYVTAVLWFFAIPYWISTDQCTQIYTAYIKPLDENHSSVRMLGVTSKGDKVWKADHYPELHNRIQEVISQSRFLKNKGTAIN